MGYNEMLERIKYGNTNTYLLKGDNANILIDTDYAGTLPGFYCEIKGKNIKVSDITYVLATHYHPDHIGLVSCLMDLGVTLLIVDSQLDKVHYADAVFAREPHLRYKPIDESRAKIISISGSRRFLKQAGIDGEIITTQSHSSDSISVVLDDGICIVGDLEPIDYLEAYSGNEALKNDWDKVLSFNPQKIFYAHANEKNPDKYLAKRISLRRKCECDII